MSLKSHERNYVDQEATSGQTPPLQFSRGVRLDVATATSQKRTGTGGKTDERHQDIRIGLFKLKESVTLDPRIQRKVTGIMLDGDGQKPTPPPICIETAKIPIEGVMSGRRMSQVTSATSETQRWQKAKRQNGYNAELISAMRT
jgi:hypothetical protein